MPVDRWSADPSSQLKRQFEVQGESQPTRSRAAGGLRHQTAPLLRRRQSSAAAQTRGASASHVQRIKKSIVRPSRHRSVSRGIMKGRRS